MSPPKRGARPRAFRLDDPNVVITERGATSHAEAGAERRGAPPPEREAVVIEPQPDPYAGDSAGPAGRAEATTEVAQRSGIAARHGWSWGRLLWSALGCLVSMGIGLWITALIENLFARSQALGMAGLVLAGLIGLTTIALLLREAAGIMRQARIAKLHAAFAVARAADDRDAARTLVRGLARLYVRRPAMARARAEVVDLCDEIVDGRDLIDIAERTLVHPLDERVRREIAAATKRVSLMTAVSPRALLDVVFVAAQAIYLMRKTAEIYGGRPGLFGFFKLMRSVATHLALTGGMAVGDSIIQQFLGHGIASRLSARLGEGVLNGLLTARIGLAAMAVCRPMPFAAERPPGVKDVAPFLFSAKEK